MRRVVLLALVALALPTSTLASSINFSTGTFESGTITSNLGNPFSVSVLGMNGISISLSNITLVPNCSSGSVTTCMFSSGTLTVMQASSVVFTSSLSNGILKKSGPGGNDITIAASVVAGSCSLSIPCTSGTVLFNNLMKEGNHLAGGSATVAVSLVPEPGTDTLGLLGTGLIGLAAISRRKRRFGDGRLVLKGH